MADNKEDPGAATSHEDRSSYRSSNSSEGRDLGEQERHRELFVDRDDDHSPPLVDSDFGNDFPDSDLESEDVDPGYAAFSSELEDPLADWPFPDSALDELPEARQRQELPEQPASAREPEAEPPPVEPPQAFVEPDPVNDGGLSSSEGDFMVFDDADDGPDPLAPDVADSDQLSASDSYEDFPDGKYEVESLPPVTPVPVASHRELEAPGEEFNENRAAFAEQEEVFAEKNEAATETGKSFSTEGFDEQAFDDEDLIKDDFAAAGFNEESFEEEFVDDFLNDLDPPQEDEHPADDGFDQEEDFDTPLGASIAASSVEKAAPIESSDMRMTNTDSDETPLKRAAQSPETDSRDSALPLGMIAVVAVALLLLGIGGYGVMQQRSDMQAEIRDLQARLATTVTPEEAEAERESQRQVQLQNESLSTELEALSAENSALAQQLAELESLRVAQANAAAEKLAQEEAAAKAAAERAAQQAAIKKQAAAAKASTGSGAGKASASGPWFVNFGSYADRTIAQRWATRLTVEQGEVTVQSATAAGKTLYRVRVIGLASQDAAERVATTLERQYKLPRLWVGKN